MRHVVITPVNNEEAFLPRLIDSMCEQSILPSRWVIVDDKSTDNSARIAKKAEEDFEWVEYIGTEIDGGRKRGSRIAKLFKIGIDSCESEWKYCSKIDADMVLPPDYFERIISKFENDGELGIASGNCKIKTIFGERVESVAKGHTRGGLKTYKGECYDIIGGVTEEDGWDGIDNVKAEISGWRTENFPEILALHQRPTGSYNGRIRGSFEAGQFAYHMGYFFPFLIARSIFEMKKWPFIIRGASMFIGFASSKVRGKERFHDVKVLQHIRGRQKRKLGSFWRN